MTITQKENRTNRFHNLEKPACAAIAGIQFERQIVYHGPARSPAILNRTSARDYYLMNSAGSRQSWLVSAKNGAAMRTSIENATTVFLIPQFTLTDVAESRGFNRSIIPPSIHREVSRRITQQAHELREQSECVSRNRLHEDNLVENLCVQMVENCLAASNITPEPQRGLSQPMIERVRDYIRRRISSPIRMTELADLAGMSRFHFCRMFQQAIGVSPSKYVLHERLRAVRRRLLEDHESLASIASISYDCGFADQAHLTRHFRSYFGTTPGKFRDS